MRNAAPGQRRMRGDTLADGLLKKNTTGGQGGVILMHRGDRDERGRVLGKLGQVGRGGR